ncbi:MAG: PEGA domain-containing protein [Bacteroidaceae bacterium]|nr:PEGA domain-containing protein [Bacteroidaceae bacterium]
MESFIETTDQDAILPGTRETDPSDGKTAMALIKVQTTERSFIFETRYGNCKVVQKVGEFWVYVPRDVPRLAIRHPRYGSCEDYDLPTGPTKSGTTYRMTLRISGGRHVDINSNPAGAELFIDGEAAGKAPVRNLFLPSGQRHLRAQAMHDRFELDTTLVITDGNLMSIDLQLQDISGLMGRVEVTAADNAEIIFRGQKRGEGSWYTDELREGTYELLTARPNCDTAHTTFRVERGKLTRVTANPPVPHTGYLNIFMRTRAVTITETNHKAYDLAQPLVPVGRYHFTFSRKGYYPEEHEYNVRRGETVNDTIRLTPISYVKPDALYFGLGYTLSSLSGITGTIGGVFHSHDLSLSYTIGLASSSNVYAYDANDLLQSGLTYKMNTLAIRYGYQVGLLPRLGFTPQVGYMRQQLTGSLLPDIGGVKYGDGATASCLTVGVKILAVPLHHAYVFLSPEYAVTLSKDADFESVAKAGDFSVGGFNLTAGILVNF